jgi:periplasmic mercuric ion binding protein
MKNLKAMLVGIVAALALTAPTWAATQTVTLKVSNMTCATCPITVKKALEKVPGVTMIAVSFEEKQAVVTFDDAKTNTNALVKATTDAGYPSKVEKGSK